MKILFVILISLSFNCFAKGVPTYEVLDIEFNYGLPFINLNVEGENVKVLLDTGARNEVLVLNKSIIAKFNDLVEFPAKFRSSDITGQMYIAKKYILPRLDIGGISFFKIRLSEDTEWGLSTGNKELTRKDGVIGLALFANKAIIIDYPNKKLVIIDGKIPPEYDINSWQQLDFKIDRSGISIFAAIDSTYPKRFILDSGSNISIIKPVSIGANEIQGGCNAELTRGTPCTFIQSRNFNVENTEYKSVFFYIYNFLEPQSDGILGYDFLIDKMIFIDFDQRIIKITSVPQ